MTSRLVFQQPKRAVLLFTRAPEQEATHKQIVGTSYAERLALYYTFITQAMREATATGADVVVATDEPHFTGFAGATCNFHQRGKAFGERLTFAAQAAFALGYDEIVIIGNDCIDLTSERLKEAFASLTNHKLCFGKAQDGGVYLIAARREVRAVLPKLFAACRWETAQVQKDLMDAASGCACSFVMLGVLNDIDTASDIIAFSNSPLAVLRQLSRKLSARHCCDASPALSPFISAHHIGRQRHQKAPPIAPLF